MAQSRRRDRAVAAGKVTWHAQPLILEGTPYQRGLAHGVTLRNEIQAVVSLWEEALERDFSRPSRSYTFSKFQLLSDAGAALLAVPRFQRRVARAR